MPWKWVEAPALFTHNGVTVYAVYAEDFIESGERQFHYGLSPDCSDFGRDSFDVRELRFPLPGGLDPNNPAHHRAIIEAAIDQGVIQPPRS